MIEPGGVHWADLGVPNGSRPAKERPVLVIQSDEYNESGLATVLVAVLSGNADLADMPGNTLLPGGAATGLRKDSVVNDTALVTLNKSDLGEQLGCVGPSLMHEVDKGLRRVLAL